MIHVHAAGALGEPIGARLSREDDGVREKPRTALSYVRGAAADAAGMAESSRRSTIQTHTNRFIITHSFLSSGAPYRDTPGG